MGAGALLDVVRWALFGLSHLLAGSLGGGIIALSLLVRLALLPWGLRAARRSAAMKVKLALLRPRLQALEKRHEANPAMLRTAIFAEYRAAGVNPLGGLNAGLLAVQIPIGWAVYSVISSGISAGDAFLWITSLARPDAAMSVVVGALSTLVGATIPSTGGSTSPFLIASVMGITSALIVFHMSAGIGLYWASTSCVGILQNAILRRTSATAGSGSA